MWFHSYFLAGIKQVVDEIKAIGGKCTGYVCDVTNREEIYRVAKTVKIEVGNVSKIANYDYQISLE